MSVPIAALKLEITHGSTVVVPSDDDDVSDPKIHLGMLNEVSSFDLKLVNEEGKYSKPSSDTYVGVGDSLKIWIGRKGEYLTKILTGRIEEVECNSQQAEHYMTIRGRDLGEDLFRKNVLKTYENMEGSLIVKDVIENYTSLGHVRDSVELIEGTGTVYQKLEFQDVPVFDVLKQVANSAVGSVSGAVGYDFKIAPDGLFEFFERMQKTSVASLTGMIEYSTHRKDIHRIRNWIRIFGAIGKKYPLDGDQWTEYDWVYLHARLVSDAWEGQRDIVVDDVSPFEVGDEIHLYYWPDQERNTIESIDPVNSIITMVDNLSHAYPANTLAHVIKRGSHIGGFWYGSGFDVQVENGKVIAGSRSVKLVGSGVPWDGIAFTLPRGYEIDCDEYPFLQFFIAAPNTYSGHGWISLEDVNGVDATREMTITSDEEWNTVQASCGKKSESEWTPWIYMPDWKKVMSIFISLSALSNGSFWIDGMFFDKKRWESLQEDAVSINTYGKRELIETNEEFHSDDAVYQRARSLLAYLKDPAEYLTVETSLLTGDNLNVFPGEKIPISIPNDNINSNYRIVSVDHRIRGTELETTLELGWEPPLYPTLFSDYAERMKSLERGTGRGKIGFN